MPDDRIRELSEAIKHAAASKQWKLVEDLNLTLRQALRHRSHEHAQAIGRAQAAGRAYEALEAKEPNAPLLAAFAADQRFGSLRKWCAIRGEDKSAVSLAARGKQPMKRSAYMKIKRDFPELEWEPPKGVKE